MASSLVNLPGSVQNDLRSLDGWVFDASQAINSGGMALPVGTVINSGFTFPPGSGVSSQTSLQALTNTYVVQGVFNKGDGYFGVLLKIRDPNNNTIELGGHNT